MLTASQTINALVPLVSIVRLATMLWIRALVSIINLSLIGIRILIFRNSFFVNLRNSIK